MKWQMLTTLYFGTLITFCQLAEVTSALTDQPSADVQEPRCVLSLPPSPDNPRNSEGDLIQLKSGRLMFVYTHFYSGAGDAAQAHLTARFSEDNGATWTDQDVRIVENEGNCNVMSVSLLRLQNGSIALFYIRKNSLADCLPYMRTSLDEGRSWSEPQCCITDEPGYYVLNNDRAVQLSNGRLILPVAQHNRPELTKPDWTGRVMCYLSDDNGKTWRRSRTVLEGRLNSNKRWITQEPGVVELNTGKTLLFCRSNAGCQLISWSKDQGDSWSQLEKSEIISPVSPASIERIPTTGDLLLIWNDHRDISSELAGKRTPLCAAISRDEGATWQLPKVIADNPHGWYCYVSITFIDDHVLLSHCAGDRRQNNGLAESKITRFSLDWLYE